MILINHNNVKEMTQEIYKELVKLITITALTCPCGHVGFHFHGSYERSLKLSAVVITLVVRRIRCPECGKTHALLPYDIIPWSQIPLDTMILIIKANRTEKIRNILKTKLALQEEDVINAKRRFRKYWKERMISYGISLDDESLTDRCLSEFKRQFMQNHCGFIIKYPFPTFLNLVPERSSL